MDIKSLIRGWTRTYSGDGVVLSVPNGTVEIRPGVTPLRPVEAIWRPLVAADATLEGPFGLVTSEGEYGVIVNGVSPGEQTTVAIVLGEHGYTSIHARTTDPAQFATFLDVVRRLAHTFPLGLGVERRRPYFYDPPPGWTGIARAFSTLWVAPDCGHRRATIHVFHARPQRTSAPTTVFRQLFEQLSREFGTTPRSDPQVIASKYGLRGQLVTSRGVVGDAALQVSDAGFDDARMLYLLRLETAAKVHDEHMPAFRALLESVQPIPAPKADVEWLVEWFAAT